MNDALGSQAAAIRVRLDDICVRDDFQVRGRLDPAHITKLATVLKNGGEFDKPVTLADIDGALVLVDGWHRMAASKKLDRWEIAAVVVTATEKEARWMAGRANLLHGLPLKSRDYLNVFHSYMKAGGYWKSPRTKTGVKTYAAMAVDMGNCVRRETIFKWTRKHYPHVARLIGGRDDDAIKGGLPENIPKDAMADEVRTALTKAVAAFRGVQDTDTRRDLIEAARRCVAEMEQGEGWKPLPVYDTPDF